MFFWKSFCCCSPSPSAVIPNENQREVFLEINPTLKNVNVTLKAPGGKICNDSKCNSIEEWMTLNIFNHDWKGELFYNDHPPFKKNAFSNGGHCKGIVVWNNEKVGWLIHSVPKFPSVFLNEIPSAECIYGQSFAWIVLPINKKKDILSQLQLMGAHVYHDPSNAFIHISMRPSPENACRIIELDNNIFHIAKNESWGKDLFEDGIVPAFPNTQWKTETWSRPGQPPTKNVDRIEEVNWSVGNIHFSYNEHNDYSKWAISDKEHVWIGDINAMSSQFHRGGGGIIIKNTALFRTFYSMIGSSQQLKNICL